MHAPEAIAAALRRWRRSPRPSTAPGEAVLIEFAGPARRPTTQDVPLASTSSLDEPADDAHSILQHTPFMFTRCSADLRYKYVSPAYAHMIGHLPEEIVGRPIAEMMGQEGLNTILPYIERVLAGEQVQYETQVPFKGVGDRVLNVTYIPDHDASGKVQGWVASIIDVTKERQTEHRVAADLARLAAIVKSSDDAIVTKDLNGIITSWNEGAARLFGYTANEVIGKPISILIPPDRSNEEPSILERLRKGIHIDHYETVRMCKDGRLIDISLSVSPLMNAEGKIIGASKIARDITERKRAAAAKEMLTKEMSHRLKNTFAVFNSIVAISAHSSPTPKDMARQIRERITALALAHDLTRPGLVGAATRSSSPTTFHALARAIFAPYIQPSTTAECERIILKGVDLPLAQRSMANWALFLHELATNAVKYGSLSSAQGQVEIELTDADGKLLMSWKEKGGPPLNGPSDQEGFGSVMARQIITGHFAGQLSYQWNAHGLLVQASIPQDRLASEEASPFH